MLVLIKGLCDNDSHRFRCISAESSKTEWVYVFFLRYQLYITNKDCWGWRSNPVISIIAGENTEAAINSGMSSRQSTAQLWSFNERCVLFYSAIRITISFFLSLSRSLVCFVQKSRPATRCPVCLFSWSAARNGNGPFAQKNNSRYVMFFTKHNKKLFLFIFTGLVFLTRMCSTFFGACSNFTRQYWRLLHSTHVD